MLGVSKPTKKPKQCWPRLTGVDTKEIHAIPKNFLEIRRNL